MKTCIECEAHLQGRADKKFCSDACRNNFNNRQKSAVTLLMRQINTILKKNRNVLAALMPAENTKLSRDKLLESGFNFSYFTNTYTNKKGLTYFYCYEYGYLPIENNFYLIVKRREEALV